MPTKIEWADEVWNPTTGCTKVSAGCKNCYAERLANRFWGERKFSDVRTHPERVVIPLRWKKPKRIFVDSMSDLFHPDVPDEFILYIWKTMIFCDDHTFLVLTKRPERMESWINTWTNKVQVLSHMAGIKSIAPLRNAWLGVSVEDQQTADERIPWLMKTPAAVRFVSYEPALGPVDFDLGTGCLNRWLINTNGDRIENPDGGIDWVIAGCESGPGARPADIDWFRSVRDQCKNAEVPFFLKQMMIDGKLVKMPILDGKVWAEYPR